MPDRMSESRPDRISLGGDHSKKVIWLFWNLGGHHPTQNQLWGCQLGVDILFFLGHLGLLGTDVFFCLGSTAVLIGEADLHDLHESVWSLPTNQIRAHRTRLGSVVLVSFKLQNQIFITIPYLLAIFVCSYESHGAFIEKMSLSNYPQIWPFTNYKWLYWLFLWDKKHFINGVSSVRVPCTWYFGHNCMFQFASCLKLPSKWPGAVAACRSTLVESQGLGWCARGLRAGGWRWRGQTRGVLSYVVNDSFNFTNWLSSWLTN